MTNEIILAPDDDIIQQEQIENLIYTVRGVQVILDRDLARLYGVDTRSLNQSVKRNSTRFPERYMFQLTKDEAEYLLCSKSQNVTLKKQRGQNIKYLPFAFTEQGVTQLSAVLRSPTASAIIYTYKVGKSLTVLIDEYNKQYPSKPLEICKWATKQHDRWLVIDNQLWHCGASIKDAGRQTFCIDPINLDANIILTQL